MRALQGQPRPFVRAFHGSALSFLGGFGDFVTAQGRLGTAVKELRAEVLGRKAGRVAPPAASPPLPRGFASLIIADFPALFAEFRGKRFSLLWRGSRNGFDAADFHGRCDGRAPTLTLIQDKKGNIFGGFTPIGRESQNWKSRDFLTADPSLKSFGGEEICAERRNYALV
jgi:hypothetical protein